MFLKKKGIPNIYSFCQHISVHSSGMLYVLRRFLWVRVILNTVLPVSAHRAQGLQALYILCFTSAFLCLTSPRQANATGSVCSSLW